MKFLTAIILSSSLSAAAFAGNSKHLMEGSSIYIGKNKTSEVEYIFDIHHPGLVRWLENGSLQESYTVPGCFVIAKNRFDKNTTSEQLSEIAQSLEILFEGRKSLALENINGTNAFVDFNVETRYVGFYTVRPKNGLNFDQVYSNVFKDKLDHQGIELKFSRGCTDILVPPFAK